MLNNMFLGDPPGNYDRILNFSTAVTGSLFFVPTADFLDDPSGQPLASSSEVSRPDQSQVRASRSRRTEVGEPK